MCYARYLTNVRVQNSRIMASACIDPYLKDLGAKNSSTDLEGKPRNISYCPLLKGEAGSGPSECCREVMVLRGSYRVDDLLQDGTANAHKGRRATWQIERWLNNTTVPVYSTIVPGNKVAKWDGTTMMTEMHHLWQLAGPNGTMYPDCSGSAGPSPCSPNDGQNGKVDTSHNMNILGVSGTSVRALLVGGLSALATTNTEHVIDIRWSNDVGSTYMPNHTGWNLNDDPIPGTKGPVSLEGGWALGQYWVGGNAWQSSPFCISQSARQFGTTLVSNLGECGSLSNIAAALKTHHDPDDDPN
jgi:hypothetical protein